MELTDRPVADAHQSEQGATWGRMDDATWVRGDSPEAAFHSAARLSQALVTDVQYGATA
jgi:GH35 family endo-1,4-beta-xylanase